LRVKGSGFRFKDSGFWAQDLGTAAEALLAEVVLGAAYQAPARVPIQISI